MIRMTKTQTVSILTAGGLFALALATPMAAHAAERAAPDIAAATEAQSVPPQLSAGEREKYRTLFGHIRAQRWADARVLLDSLPKGGINDFARAELLLAAGSPKADPAELAALVTAAPNLPQASRLATLASKRGALSLPVLPSEQRLQWAGGPPRRTGAERGDDPAAAGLVRSIPERIKNDDPAGAEALLTAAMPGMTDAARAEWQQRVAWSYYIENDDVSALRLAHEAASGTGEWPTQASWIEGLAAWRSGDYRTADTAFTRVAREGADSETRAAGAYWSARTAMALGQPAQVQPRLRQAAANNETFYGILASDSLGLAQAVQREGSRTDRSAWRRLSDNDNVKLAVALNEIGESDYADDVLRHQARIGRADQHQALAGIANALSLPETQLFLAHNTPGGKRPDSSARYPMPNWQPTGGWRVDPALVFAHTLQESQFKRNAVSPAGAMGLMQVRPGTAKDIARWRGSDEAAAANLRVPAVNMDFGQSYLQYLAGGQATGGLLPKVIAAYNAGPTPIARWNSEVHDGGDPLLYIESIPYWETRGYVATVLRNYWMYEQQVGTDSDSRTAIAQGRWPAFPDLTKGRSIQLSYGTALPNAD
ncbi:MAG: hypothetical protein RLZZ58_1092 [Pseudomonadota bacterium]